MPTFTLASLRSKVYARVEDNSSLYPVAEVDAVINECLRIVALYTGFYRDTAAVPTGSIASQLVYDTPDGILIPSIVTFSGRQLQKTTLRNLARSRRTWATDTTATRGPVEFWAPIGNSQFVITPMDAVGGKVINVSGMAEPPLMAKDDDVLSFENEYVDLITEYGAHRLPLKEGGPIFNDGSLSLNDFYSKLSQRKQRESFKRPKYWLLQPKQGAGQ